MRHQSVRLQINESWIWAKWRFDEKSNCRCNWFAHSSGAPMETWDARWLCEWWIGMRIRANWIFPKAAQRTSIDFPVQLSSASQINAIETRWFSVNARRLLDAMRFAIILVEFVFLLAKAGYTTLCRRHWLEPSGRVVVRDWARCACVCVCFALCCVYAHYYMGAFNMALWWDSSITRDFVFLFCCSLAVLVLYAIL